MEMGFGAASFDHRQISCFVRFARMILLAGALLSANPRLKDSSALRHMGAALLAVMGAAVEFGWRLGRRRHARAREDQNA